MKEESEEARLIGNKSKTSSMAYTDGPKGALVGAGFPPTPTPPPPYETTITIGTDCHGDKLGRKNSQGAASEHSQDSELLNELMNSSGTTLLTQFHADALKQVGFGKGQMVMILFAGLAVAAQAIQFFSLYFVLPSIVLEFCLVPPQRDIVVVISIMGAAFGAFNMGSIAEINGRRRTLLSCLGCMTVCSIVSAFMPTYEPFMMARFCSSICAGGIFPISATYISEMTPASMRGRSMAVFAAIGLLGGTVAAAASIVMLPMSGEQLMLEHRTHFSAWHSYLLLISLCSVIPLIGVFFLPESPRWLLDIGREQDALEIYQKIYSSNRKNGKYTLTELELPKMRSDIHSAPKSVLNIISNCVYQYFDSFGCLVRSPYKKTSYILAVIWFVTMFVTYGLSIYVLKFGTTMENQLFNARSVTTFNVTFENISLTSNIINQHFQSCRFFNCTFDQMFLSYVQFTNCTFLDTNFHGVKTGNTSFTDSYLNNVKFIDTDLGDQNFLNCNKNNTVFDRMCGGCELQFDFNTIKQVDYHANIGYVVPALIALLWSGEALNRLGRIRMATFIITLATMACCLVGFLCLGELVYWIVGIVQACIFAGLIALTVFTTEYYCSYLRCAALGVLVCFGHFGAFLGARVYVQLPVDDTHIAAVISIAALSFPTILTTFLKETSQLL